MLTHLGICHSAMHYEYCMGLTAHDRALVAVPMSHVTGVIALIAAMTRAAAALIVMREFKAAEFLKLAARERMTHSLMVPAMYNLCLLDPAFAQGDYSAWRVGGYGGAPMAPATIARFADKLPGLNLMNAYGATETTSPVTLMPPSETARRPDSVGCALPCADILVMDDAGREVPRRRGRRAVARRPDGGEGILGRPGRHGGEHRRRLLALGRHRLEGCRRLRARVRPQEGHDQPRRLQDLFGRGRERADELSPAWSRPPWWRSPARCWASACTPSWSRPRACSPPT